MPLSLLIEGPNGEEISRTGAGAFQYMEGSGDEVTRTGKMLKHDTTPAGQQQVDQTSPSPKTEEQNPLGADSTTNNYEYPAQQTQYGGAFPQANSDMITTTYQKQQLHGAQL